MQTVRDVSASVAVASKQDKAVALSAAGAVVGKVTGEVLDASSAVKIGAAEAGEAVGGSIVSTGSAGQEAILDAYTRKVGVVVGDADCANSIYA